MKETKIETLNTPKDKTTPSGYPKIAKLRPYLVSIFQQKYDYFLFYFVRFLVKKGRGHTLKTRTFLKIFNPFFKFGCFSRYHAPILEKNDFDFLVKNLILQRLTQF